MKYQQPPHTFVSKVALKVTDIEKAVQFYKDAIGLRILERGNRRVYFTADGKNDILIIEQPKNVVSAKPFATGLYHIAILLPNRTSLADQMNHFKDSGVNLIGASDHHVSEAVYLEDPDGNGIEMYTDRQYVEPDQMGTSVLDIGDLMKEASGNQWKGVPPETVIGHIHLKVAAIPPALDFYRGILGFDLVMMAGGSAAFLSTGGYHHHVGLNTWQSEGAEKAPENSAGLDYLTMMVPDQNSQETIKRNLNQAGIPFTMKENGALTFEDPSGNQIKLAVYGR